MLHVSAFEAVPESGARSDTELDVVMRFEVLGPLRAWDGDKELDLGFPQQRALLSMLLAQAGRPVGTSTVIDALWGEDPPDSAVNMVRRYVGGLRRLLEPGLAPRAPGRRLIRRAGGYVLQVEQEEFDLLEFRGLTEGGTRAVATGRTEEAVSHFIKALGLWQGEVAMGIPPSVRAHALFSSIERELVHTAQLAADAALLCDRADDVLSWLRRAVALDPLNEPLHARVVMTLAAAGFQAEALVAFEEIRHRLLEELGVSPGPELSDAHMQVLRQQRPPSDGEREPEAPEARRGATEATVRPAQLPAELGTFAGRRAELSRLGEITHKVSAGPGAPVAVLISGMAGVGKTTLAVKWSGQVADQFPDGQFYVDLRGFDPARNPMPPLEALRHMLEGLGIPPERIPRDIDARAGLFRSLLNGRRVLVVLDNAWETGQVRPLLASSVGCLTLITSRSALPGLTTAGVLPLPLDLPSFADAHTSLVLRAGAERLAADPQAAAEIITQCGRLPLALAIVAARTQRHPHFPLAAIAAELRDTHNSLDALSSSDPTTDARAAFTCSYQLLPPDGARLFRLLSLHPGPSIAAAAAAALTALPIARARLMLAELADAHLLNELMPGRYGLHHLLRTFAVELTATHDTPAERQAAQLRMLDHYLHTAYSADQILGSKKNRLDLSPAQPDSVPGHFTDRPTSLAWFTAERDTLAAVIPHALDTGFFTQAWQLPCCLQDFLYSQGGWELWAATQRTAVEAARLDGSLLGEITTLRKLARALAELKQFDEAREHLDLAFVTARELDDPTEQALTHGAMSFLLQAQGSYYDALSHSEAAIHLFRQTGLRSSEALGLSSIAWIHARLGNYTEAIKWCHRAIELGQRIGQPEVEAYTFDTMALAYLGLGDFHQAISCCHRALKALPYGEHFYQATFWERLGDSHEGAGDHPAARSAWQQSATLYEQLERPEEADRLKAKLDGSATSGQNDLA
ncbi:tetratricopeptide repeat protein [Streptomyces sp. SID13666]|uniref:BTAD domain-containing putative transcriptional regulator n=1 Tax=unclassified Streptomyces TaxID=2593676 RepID=UPI0013BFEB06|nr:tetratricopeptide repeat protein [Streptomyces sp. SID13666]NEA76578.1 tetratricopeptide repeat protein [Streptomyces sp. SID13588]